MNQVCRCGAKMKRAVRDFSKNI